MKLTDVGVPNYDELMVATNDDYARQNPDVVRRFVGALVKGHQYALDHPKAARDALLAANEQLDPEVVDEALRLTVPVFGAGSGRVGYQDPQEWQTYVGWAAVNGVLPEPIDVDKAMTNEYLPET